jgi:major intracellular serine protease
MRGDLMMRHFARIALLAILATAPYRVFAKTIHIAVIDTGIDAAVPKLCKVGHKSFVKSLPDPLQDEHGHGTHIAGIISSIAGDGDYYCLISIKYYDGSGRESNLTNLIKSIQYAVSLRVDFINISGGGEDPSDEERKTIEKALDNGINVVVAAGNDGKDLDKDCNYFPACYDTRIIMVGNLLNTSPPTPAPSSNHGSRVTRWEVGTHIKSTLPGGHVGTMSGTSQATAVATGKMVRFRKY